MVYVLNFDGACEPNPGEMGIGVVVYNDHEQQIIRLSEKCGLGTNIKAEYLALIRGLEELSKMYKGPLQIQGDLQLVIKQLNNEWKVKQSDIRSLFVRVKSLADSFETVKYRWVRREENKEADALSAKALGLDLRKRDEVKVQLSPGHTYEFVFSDDDYITTVHDERYGRNVIRYYVRSVQKDGKRSRGTYFETASKRLIKSLEIRKPLKDKRIRIIPTKQQKWIEYLIDEL